MSARDWTTGRRPALAVGLVAVLGAVYSYASVYAAAAKVFGPWLAAGFPLLADALIAACSLYYVGTVRKGRPQHGYRWTAHAGIAATVALNALAAHTPREIPWHIIAPAVWGVLVELRAREALGDYRAEHGTRLDRFPLRLWLTAPLPTLLEWLWAARAGIRSHTAARAARGRYAAARAALRLTVPGRSGRGVRRLVARQLRSGSLAPAALVHATGLASGTRMGADYVLRAALLAALEEPTGPVPGSEADPLLETTSALLRAVPDMGRPALVDALREQGHRVGTDRAAELLRAARVSLAGSNGQVTG